MSKIFRLMIFGAVFSFLISSHSYGQTVSPTPSSHDPSPKQATVFTKFKSLFFKTSPPTSATPTPKPSITKIPPTPKASPIPSLRHRSPKRKAVLKKSEITVIEIPAETSTTQNRNSCFFIKVSGNLNYVTLDQLGKGALTWNQQVAQSPGQGGASNTPIGFGLHAEGVFNFSPMDAVGLRLEYGGGHGYQEKFSYNGSSQHLNLDPQLFAVGLEYFRYLPSDTGNFFIVAAPIFGMSLVNFDGTDSLAPVTGTLTGTGFGFEAGIGNEWKISSMVGFELSGRFRVLSVTRIETGFRDSFGGTGRLALVKTAQGNVGLADTQLIGQSGIQYATLDFTGFNFDFSFNFYLF